MAKKAKKKQKKTSRRAIDDTKKKSKAAARPVKKKAKKGLTFGEYIEMSKDELETHLSLQERRFCVLYTSEQEFFCNGVRSYAKAYRYTLTKKGAYAVCSSCASALLKIPKIRAYQVKILDVSGLNDEFVDKQLAKVITQDMDFGDKIRAINEYNKLKGRHTKNVNLNVKGRLQVEPVMFGTPTEE